MMKPRISAICVDGGACASSQSRPASRGRAGQGQGRRIPGQLVAALFRGAASAAIFKEQNIEPEMIKLMGGPPNVAAMITNQIEVSAVLVTLEGLNADRQEAGRGDVHRHEQPERDVPDGAIRRPQRPRRQGNSLKDLKGAKMMSAPGPANVNTAKAHSGQGRAQGRRLHHRSARHGPARQRHEGRHIRWRLYARAERVDDAQDRRRQDARGRRDRQIRARRSEGRCLSPPAAR